MADTGTTAAKTGGEDSATAKATIKAGTVEAAKAKAAKGVSVTDGGDGTYTVAGKTGDGHEWSKTFVSTDGTSHGQNSPDSAYVAKVKAHLSKGLNGDDLGQDSDKSGTYKGKSMEAGGGGRSQMMKDRITMELVSEGRSHEEADSIARSAAKNAGVKKYGADQMDKWAKASQASKATKAA